MLVIYSFVFLLFTSALIIVITAMETITTDTINIRGVDLKNRQENAKAQIIQKIVKSAFRQGCFGWLFSIGFLFISCPLLILITK